MSSGITDSDDVPVTYMNFSQEESTDSAVFILKIPCATGMVLKAADNPDVSIFGRPAGIGSYVDLFTDPIDLDPYAGTNHEFELLIRTNSVSGLVSTAVQLTAGSP